MATKVNDVWQFVIYDAFGKLVAEYGTQGEGIGGVSYVLQDWQGSVRASVNNNGFVQARFDFTAFGEEVSLGVGLRSLEQGYTGDATTKQGYGLTEKDSSGQNHTWFRKQENKAGRWTSPDPYKGSMSIGNPQSFNRYSYVGGDAINFVDPSGLYLIAIASCSTVCVDGPPGVGGCETTCTWEYIEIGGGGGWTPFTPVDDDPVTGTDCQQFSIIVGNYARRATSNTNFINTIYKEFSSKADSRFSAGGFNSNFVDSGGSPNQVRHATGAIYAGFLAGATYWGAQQVGYATGNSGIANSSKARGVALTASIELMNTREVTVNQYGVQEPDTQSQTADKALNSAAVPLGFRLGAGEINRNELAGEIRRTICS